MIWESNIKGNLQSLWKRDYTELDIHFPLWLAWNIDACLFGTAAVHLYHLLKTLQLHFSFMSLKKLLNLIAEQLSLSFIARATARTTETVCITVEFYFFSLVSLSCLKVWYVAKTHNYLSHQTWVYFKVFENYGMVKAALEWGSKIGLVWSKTTLLGPWYDWATQSLKVQLQSRAWHSSEYKFVLSKLH